MLKNLLSFFFFISFLACIQMQKTPESSDSNGDTEVFVREKEAREDSIELAAAYEAQKRIQWEVFPAMETKAVNAASMDDAADDPAIWVHPTKPEQTLIFGSNKKGGLAAYNLKGEEVAYYALGNINNVDVLNGLSLGDSSISIVGGSNRSSQSIEIFKIHPTTGALENIKARDFPVDTQLIDDIYGFCFAKSTKTEKAYCLINGKNGLVQQYEMLDRKGKLDLKLVRSIQFETQTEGMVADNENDWLYVGEEQKGIWKLSLDPASGSEKSFLKNSGKDNPNINYDVEGITLYQNGDQGYLIASSQGNFSYAVFDRRGENDYLGSFKIASQASIDGVEETDGLDVVADSISAEFPKGILVVQDGFNYEEEDLQPQNFKILDLGPILDSLAAQK